MADAFEGLTGTSRVAADAAARGLAVEIIPRPPANSLTEAAALLGVAPSGIVKTLVVGRHDGGFLLALVPGGRKISWPKLRALVGVNRLAMPDPEVAKEATGYERGTITPLGSAIAWPVFADVTIVGQTIHLGAGGHGFSARVEADELIAAYGVTVADITEPET